MESGLREAITLIAIVTGIACVLWIAGEVVFLLIEKVEARKQKNK